MRDNECGPDLLPSPTSNNSFRFFRLLCFLISFHLTFFFSRHVFFCFLFFVFLLANFSFLFFSLFLKSNQSDQVKNKSKRDKTVSTFYCVIGFFSQSTWNWEKKASRIVAKRLKLQRGKMKSINQSINQVFLSSLAKSLLFWLDERIERNLCVPVYCVICYWLFEKKKMPELRNDK